MIGGEHSLDGIVNFEARETTDEQPQRVTAIQQVSTAFLRRALYGEEAVWKAVVDGCTYSTEQEVRIEAK